MKLFLGRRSHLLSQKQGYTKGSKTIHDMAIKQCFNQTYAAQTRRESSLRGDFSQDVQFDSFGSQKQGLDVLRKLETPSSYPLP